MSNLELFSAKKNCYRGNLHTHSTISDGKHEPAEVVRRYQELGYDFLAFTDHEIFSWWKEFNTEKFLVLPGIEMSGRAPGPYQCHHLVGIGGSKVKEQHLQPFDNRDLVELAGAQSMVNTLNASGYFSIYCHPVWSRQTFAEIADLQGFQGIEVFNNSCHVENATGHASYYWDSFLRQGKRIWGLATDDSHNHVQEYGGGWIVVNAETLSEDVILQALQQGRFYSSTGPSIESFVLNDDRVSISCSPAQEIHFIAFEQRGQSFIAKESQSLTTASYTLRGQEKYVRVEIIDERGKIAWSNPIFL